MNAECYLCHLKRSTDIARGLAGEAGADIMAKKLMPIYANAPEYYSSPLFEPAVTQILQEHCGLVGDRFRAEKDESNQFALSRIDSIRRHIEEATDPVYAALQMAVLGNYIDFSALRGEVDLGKLEEMLKGASSISLDADAYAAFIRQLEAAKKLLYITDNCGEIVFDRLCAETLVKRFPSLSITFCVRGGNAANDATREDALAVGIEFPVIDTGMAVAGVPVELLEGQAKDALEEADVILSKGQANVETLFGCGHNIFYLFLIKCQRFQTLFGKEKLTPMFLRERKE